MTFSRAPAEAGDRNSPERTLLLREPTRTPEEQARLDERMHWIRIGLGTAVPVAVLLSWQLLATRGWIDPRLFPAPTTVWSDIVTLAHDGQLWSNFRVTLSRIVVGYLIGATGGVILGALMGRIRLIRAALQPMMNAIYVMPHLALFPIYLTIFGLGSPAIVGLVCTTVFFFSWMTTMGAFIQIPDGYVEAARSLELSRTQTFFQVLVPPSLPQVFVGLRVAMNVAILETVGAEFVVGSNGLGYLIENAREIFIPQQIYAGIAVVSVMGVSLSASVSIIGYLCTPWTRS